MQTLVKAEKWEVACGECEMVWGKWEWKWEAALTKAKRLKLFTFFALAALTAPIVRFFLSPPAASLFFALWHSFGSHTHTPALARTRGVALAPPNSHLASHSGLRLCFMHLKRYKWGILIPKWSVNIRAIYIHQRTWNLRDEKCLIFCFNS